MSVPKAQPGLVISYSYLWAREHTSGAEEGLKDRPCAIVAARQIFDGNEIVTVLPITHSPPSNLDDAVEIPKLVKEHLGLDDLPSWVIVTETNDFVWPGPDLRPVPKKKPKRYDYGFLPPRFLKHIQEKFLKANEARRLQKVKRTQ